MIQRRNWSGIILAAFVVAVLAFVLIPALAVLVLSFNSSRYLSFPPPGLSLRWYSSLVSKPEWGESLFVSVYIAVVVTAMSLILGGLAAIGITRGRGRLRYALATWIGAPLVIPAVIVAVGSFFLYGRLGLLETRLGLILAHTVIAIPVATLTIGAGLVRASRTTEVAARTMGAGPVEAFLRVTLPGIRRSMIAAAIFSFIISFDEPVLAIFLAGTKVVTLPKRMWDGIRYEIDPTVAAASAVIVAISCVLVLAAARSETT